MVGGFDVSRAVGPGIGDWRRARDFIAMFAAAWTRPLAPGDGCSEDELLAAEDRLGVRVPAALREAYLPFGGRRDLTACQDPLLPPGRLRLDRAAHVIVFRTENQYCAEWGVAAAGRDPGDPPVYVRLQPGDGPWKPFLRRVSLACAEMVLTEVLLGSEFMDMCDLPGELTEAPGSAYRQVALPEYPLWTGTGIAIRWFAAPGKLLRMDGQGPYCWLSAAGQTRTDLESIYQTIPGPWTSRALALQNGQRVRVGAVQRRRAGPAHRQPQNDACGHPRRTARHHPTTGQRTRIGHKPEPPFGVLSAMAAHGPVRAHNRLIRNPGKLSPDHLA